MKSASIQKRLALWFTLTIVVLLAVFSLLIYAALTPTITNLARQRVIRDGAAVAEQVHLTDGALSVNQVLISPDTLYTIYTADGSPAFANHRQRWFNDQPIDEDAIVQIEAGGQEWILQDSAVAGPDGSTLAYVRAGIPLGAYTDTSTALITILLIAVPLLAAAALILGRRIVRRSLQPIAEMTQTAEEIGAGDFSRRLTPHGTNDEVGRLETTFNHMLDSLETSMEREKQFTSDASHELRTPLAVIIGASQTSLENNEASAADLAAAMRIIYKKSTDMQAMLSQMLLLARGDSQEKFMELTRLNVSEIVQDIAEEFDDAAAKKRIDIQTDIAPEVEITGDLMLVTRAVMNLVDNGIKYGSEGGWLRIGLKAQGGQAVLTVSDNGEGIRPENLSHIFERFYRADNSRSSSGFGLGLSLVERIAELHHGSVSVESVFGRGSIFILRLPAAAPKNGRQRLQDGALRPYTQF